MVDLHQPEPGLPAGHRWLSLTRWGMAWRTGTAVGIAGMLVFGAMVLLNALGNGSAPFAGSLLGWKTALARAVAAALLAAALGPWLRRFYPFSQALMFGALYVAAWFVALEIWGGLIDSYVASVKHEQPWTPQFGLGMIVTLLFGIPNLLGASIGYGTAIWATGWISRMIASTPSSKRNAGSAP